MSYFEQLKAPFEKLNVLYADDFMVHYMENLTGYSGSALWCASDAGTTLFRFDVKTDAAPLNRCDELKRYHHMIWRVGHAIENKKVFYACAKGRVKKINAKSVIDFAKANYKANSYAVC